MNYKDRIIKAVAEKGCKKVSEKVIKDLRKMTTGMQSGDDSPLKNIWDEVCVQVQGQESALWEYYLDVIRDIVIVDLKPIDSETEQAIWLQTEQGDDWDTDTEWKIENNEDDILDEVSVNEDDIAEYILNEYILKTAADYKNKRIEKFLDGDMGFED